MIMCWCALIVFSIFHGCGTKPLTAIASMIVDPGIDPEVAVRFMLAGLLSQIVHDRRLMREAEVNLAIRWFAAMRFTRSYLIIRASRAFANAGGRNASRLFCCEQ